MQVFFGVAIIQGQATWPAGLLWKNVSPDCPSQSPVMITSASLRLGTPPAAATHADLSPPGYPCTPCPKSCHSIEFWSDLLRRCVQMMLEVIADGALAALANILAGAVVAPDLASARLRASLADALQALGHSVSGYAGVSSAQQSVSFF